MARTAKDPWTEDEDRRLRAGRDLGITFEQIVSDYLPGRTRASAQHRWEFLKKGCGSLSTYHPSDRPIAGDGYAQRLAAEHGSRLLGEAIERYVQKYHRPSDEPRGNWAATQLDRAQVARGSSEVAA